ncbi:hypothetical protein BDR04DRAFT_864949 [Suillus decipiens]|nr:hypothetical protein BDR04DRAFT_864949 [Suillus decipiens]
MSLSSGGLWLNCENTSATELALPLNAWLLGKEWCWQAEMNPKFHPPSSCHDLRYLPCCAQSTFLDGPASAAYLSMVLTTAVLTISCRPRIHPVDCPKKWALYSIPTSTSIFKISPTTSQVLHLTCSSDVFQC